MTENDLNEKLNSPAQSQLRKLVRDLPEDVPSMAWRSELNEKLRAMSDQPVARRTPWWMRFGFAGAATTAVVALIVIGPWRAQSAVPSGSLELAILLEHRDYAVLGEVSGTGLLPNEAVRATESSPNSFQWSEEDLYSL
jgi:hypothetical protein